jgi:hypothetical protein
MKSLWILTAILITLSACSSTPARLGHEGTSAPGTHTTPLIAPE